VKRFAVAILISVCFGVGPVAGARPNGHFIRAQSGWRIYSPPDKSFTVEVPVTPHSEAEDYEGLDESTPGGWKPTHSYIVVTSLTKPRIYSISVFEVISAGRSTSDKAIDEFIHALVGKNNRLTSSQEITVAQARGRDFTMVSNNTDDIRFTRVRFIRVGARVYMLTYVTFTADDVSSGFATRFFNSFHAKR
jgi:hypothetical protein